VQGTDDDVESNPNQQKPTRPIEAMEHKHCNRQHSHECLLSPANREPEG
jgi:hypothetical protein